MRGQNGSSLLLTLAKDGKESRADLIPRLSKERRQVLKQVFVCVLLVFIFVAFPNSVSGEESCYELGYRFGLCATQTMFGLQCRPENDVIIPVRCRGKAETNRGIKAGVKVVYDALGLDTKKRK